MVPYWIKTKNITSWNTPVLRAAISWEDDHVQLLFPRNVGGANKVSLLDQQLKNMTKKFFEADESDGYIKNPKWRPLEEFDIKDEIGPQSGQEYYKAAIAEEVPYYWEK
jgi:hypothetical protein